MGNGKVCVITGANSGIGFETAKALAIRGCRVIMLCQNKANGERAMDLIRKSSGNQYLDLLVTDLSSQDSVREVVSRIFERYSVVDVLVNNAGLYLSKHRVSKEGFDVVFAVNHLAYFLVTHLLYPLLAKSPDARIVNVSSDSHFHGEMHFSDLNLAENFNGLRSYAQSKLANVLFTYELDRLKKHKNISVNAVHPGLVRTEIGSKNSNWIESLAWKVRLTFWRSLKAADGAITPVYLAMSTDVAGKSGGYWANCQQKQSSPDSYSLDNSSRLWEESLKMCKINSFF